MSEERLFRSKNDRVIAGVCGGLGEYFRVDPIIFRLLFLIFLFAGFGILIYVIAWIFVPNKKYGKKRKR